MIDGRKLRGLIPYGVESRDLGGWREVIDKGALDGARLDDLIATREHDRAKLLGRHPTTLTTEDRDDGFAWAVDLPGSPVGEDTRVALERGDLRSTSWRMVVGRDRWEGQVRHIEAIDELLDVTVTAAPAYGNAAPAELRTRPESATDGASTNSATEGATMTETATTAPADAEERTDAPPTVGLRVEDRSAKPEDTRTVDQQIVDAIRTVPKGENRALTTAIAISNTEISTTLFDRLRARSVMLQTGIRVLTTDSDSIQYPAITADATADMYAEAATVTPSDPTLGTVTATPRKMASLVQASNESLEDSDPALTEVVRDHLLTVMALKGDQQMLEGTGTAPQVRGLKNISGIQTLAAATNGQQPTYDNLADAVALLEAVNVPLSRIAIVVHTRNLNTLRKAKASGTGEYLGGGPTAGNVAAPWGVRGIWATPQLSTNETQGTSGAVANSAYVFDVENVVFVRRTDIEIDIDRSRLFNSDQSELRGRWRWDLISPNATGIVRVTGFLP